MHAFQNQEMATRVERELALARAAFVAGLEAPLARTPTRPPLPRRLFTRARRVAVAVRATATGYAPPPTGSRPAAAGEPALPPV